MTSVEKALDNYYEFFDESFPLGITSQLSDEEIIEQVEKCIRTGKKMPKPKYDGKTIW